MNLANKITMIRFILVPFYIYLYQYTEFLVTAFIVFLIASITDFLDGYIARKYNMISNLGKFLDPLADKFLVLSAFIMFSTKGYISVVFVIIFVLREISISVFRAISSDKKVVISASIYGKIKTVTQMLLIIIIHLYNILNYEMDIFIFVFTLFTAIITLYSLYDYIIKNKEVLND